MPVLHLSLCLMEQLVHHHLPKAATLPLGLVAGFLLLVWLLQQQLDDLHGEAPSHRQDGKILWDCLCSKRPSPLLALVLVEISSDSSLG